MKNVTLLYGTVLRFFGLLSVAVSVGYANLMPCVLACGLSVGWTPAVAVGALGLGLVLSVSRWTPKALADPTSGHFRRALFLLWLAGMVFVALTGTHVGTFYSDLNAGSTFGAVLSNGIAATTLALLASLTGLGLLLAGRAERHRLERARDIADLPT